MYEPTFVKAVEDICAKDTRFEAEAYLFVHEALAFTAKMLDKPPEGPERHVTGPELLAGIRTYALQEFGPMALTVFNTWGITATDDFGSIVFNLVDAGKLGRTESDKLEDFANGYDFQEAFAKPFMPATPLKQEGEVPMKRRGSGRGKREERN